MSANDDRQPPIKRPKLKQAPFPPNSPELAALQADIISKLQYENAKLETEVAQLQQTIIELKEIIEMLQPRVIPTDTAVYTHCRSSILARELRVVDFETHLTNTANDYPMQQHILQNHLLSNYFVMKLASSSASRSWKLCANLYQTFLLDTLVRSKDKNMLLTTHLLIGVVLHHYNVKDPIWKLLQRFRICPAPSTVEKYLHEQPPSNMLEQQALMIVLDNCDFWIRITHPREEKLSVILHTINWAVFSIGEPEIVRRGALWKHYDVDFFAAWVAESAEWCGDLARNTFQRVQRVAATFSLKMAGTEQDTPRLASKFLIQEPIFDCTTCSYKDIRYILSLYKARFIEKEGNKYLFLVGDEQTFTLMWMLRIRESEQFGWLIPMAGDFHWYWHVLQAIFRAWGKWLFVPIANLLGWDNFKDTAKVFEYSEDFFLLVSSAVLQIINEWMEQLGVEDIFELSDATMNNGNIHALVYFAIYYIGPYWSARGAIKCGDHEMLEDCWKYFIHLFIATGKVKYARLSIRYLWVTQHLQDNLARQLWENRFMSFSGAAASSIALDMFIEKVYI